MISLQGRKVALIGGAGFIGHNLALHLKAQGADVTIIDGMAINNLLHFADSSQDIPNQKLYEGFLQQRMELLRSEGIGLIVQDARDYHLLSHALNRAKPDVIIQLAAVAHANRSNKDPYCTFDHSLRTLENALDFSRDKVEHFIYFSSSMVYGNFPPEGVTEESVCDPLGIYGALKFAGEKMVIAYNQVFDLPYTIVRPSALYGERCVSRRVGQIFIENAMAGEDVVVNGDGSDSLDFTYIADLCHGIQCVMEREESKGEIFNLTYGESRSIAQLSDIMAEHFPDLNVRFEPKDKLMPDRGTLSVEKASELIGYAPEYPLERGFVEYINWYRSVWAEFSSR